MVSVGLVQTCEDILEQKGSSVLVAVRLGPRDRIVVSSSQAVVPAVADPSSTRPTCTDSNDGDCGRPSLLKLL